jgi:hypothetical protein
MADNTLQAEEATYAPQQVGPDSYALYASNQPVQGTKVPMWGTSDVSYAPTPNGYPAVQHLPAQQYLAFPGTIDLSQRQMIDNNAEDPAHPDPRNYGSEYSARDVIDGGYIMSYPTIYDGSVHSREEAKVHALKTGEHMGIFHPGTPDALMDQYEIALHSRPIYINGQLLNGDVWAAMKGNSKRKLTEIKKNGG